MCIDVDSLQYMCAEVRHKSNCIFILSPMFLLLQCLCGLHAAYMFEVCGTCALMLIVCSIRVLKLGISLFVYLFFSLILMSTFVE
jgi:hypothetical protein